MFLLDKYTDIFKAFLKATGGSEVDFPVNKMQPDIRFTWMGYGYWGYSEGNGYLLYCEAANIQTLKQEWESCLQQLMNEQEKENEKND